MALCENEFPKETAFIYLEEICSIFFDKFSSLDIEREPAYSRVYKEAFDPILRDKMFYYNRNPEPSDSLRELKKGVLDYRENIIKVNDILIERGEKITLVVKKAESLRSESTSYYSSVSRLKMLIT